MALFQDRYAAGTQLAKLLSKQMPQCSLPTVVLAISNVSIQLAAKVSEALDVPLDVFLVKLVTCKAQGRSIGAVASGGLEIIDSNMISEFEFKQGIARQIKQAREILLAQEQLIRGRLPEQAIAEQVIAIVDDGSSSMDYLRYIIQAVRARGAAGIIFCTPCLTDAAQRVLQGAEIESIACHNLEGQRATVKVFEDDSPVTDETANAMLSTAATAYGDPS